VNGHDLVDAIRVVAGHRQAPATLLREALEGYEAQERWAKWRTRQNLAEVPELFRDVIDFAIEFADPALDGAAAHHQWDPDHCRWAQP
jgi:hypothetical protein